MTVGVVLEAEVVPHALLDEVRPEVRSLVENAALKAAYAARESEAVAPGWQRH